MPSSQHPPSDIIPQAGKSFDDGAKSLGTKVRTVFREDKLRLYFFNNSEHFKPKARTRSGKSCTFTRSADVLAGESACDDIDDAPPGLAVKGPNVVPNREGW